MTINTIRDQLGALPRSEAATAAMTVVSALQDYQPGAQLAGALAVAQLMADEAGINIHDVLAYVRNRITDAEGKRPEFAAVTEYIKKELDK